VGTCEHGYEALSFIQGGEFLGLPKDYQLLKKSAAWSLLLLSITSTMHFTSHNKMVTVRCSQIYLEFSIFFCTGTC
jgi:hypothetical protein